MPQQQQNVGITAPGFAGLNTEDSPLSMDTSFASIANNCVIDRFGRIASRKGLSAYTQNPTILGGNPIVAVKEFITEGGDRYLFAAGNNTIYLQDTSTTFELTALSLPALYTITADDWQIVPFNEKCYFVQENHQPLVFDPATSTTALNVWAAEPAGLGGAGVDFSVDGYPNVATAAFGRLWLSDFDNNSTAVAWSGLLDGENWSTGGAGSIFTAEYWPAGYDEVTAIGGHNNFLVVFGYRNILLYQTEPDVANSLTLVDTIEAIGCIARDSVVATGIDYMFIDSTGVRSLNRTIQEKSVPVGDLSLNVRTEFQSSLANETDKDIKGVFHIEDSFYCAFLPNNPLTYVFDTRQLLPTGAARATQWVGVTVRCGVRLRSRETLFGGVGGLFKYEGSVDVNIVDSVSVESPIRMQYYTHPMDFGSPVTTIFPKQVDVTLIGGLNGSLALEWGYDYEEPDDSRRISKDITRTGEAAFWGVSEWDTDGEYITNPSPVNQLKYNIWGSGRNIKVGFDTNIEGSTVSIQELNVQALQGRIL